MTMVRRVTDDFQALLMCQASRSPVASRSRVVFVPIQRIDPMTGVTPMSGWFVFGRVDEPDKVDEAFAKLLSPP